VAAVDGAIAAGLGRHQELFVNVEPDTAGAAVPAFLEAGRDRAQAQLRVTVEITERELTRDPGASRRVPAASRMASMTLRNGTRVPAWFVQVGDPPLRGSRHSSVRTA